MRQVKSTGPHAASITLAGSVVRCEGEWTVQHLHALHESLYTRVWPQGSLQFDVSGVIRMDTGGAWLLQRLCEELRAVDRSVDITGPSKQAADLLELVKSAGFSPHHLPVPRRLPKLEQLGQGAAQSMSDSVEMLAFVGTMGRVWLRQILQPQRVRWRELSNNLGDAGYRALAIVGLLSFLLGIVIAYQGGIQLRQYGASLFVADLVGLSWTRELAPLIAAIIVAGRTGSAYTAQIGTMQVTEEIDALRSIGIDPIELLVLPKLLALLIALPLLTVYADIMGILGGMVMANAQLDLAYATFLDRVGVAVTLDSYLVGLGKSPVFAAIIATIGCYQGFQVRGSAESVGRRTTTSVVQSILAVIVVDAAFSVAFSHLGI